MKKILIVLSILTSLAFSGYASAGSWAPVEGQMLSKFTKDVDPENVWPEYPRPQMVRENNWQNLNGMWDYAITDNKSRPSSWDGEILVPFCVESALSGVKKPVSPDQLLWYRKNFKVEASGSERTLLHFGAVDWQSTLWVNGKEVGTHTGGNDPFNFDITDYVKSGMNEMVMKVYDPTDEGYQPTGKQRLNPNGIWYTPVTGIWQTVWLETVPVDYVKSLKIIPDVDNEKVNVTVYATEMSQVKLTASFNGKKVAQKIGYAGSAVELNIDNPILWGPGKGNLYDLEIVLLKDGQPVDSVESYFGMRKVEVKKDKEGINRLFVNDEAVFQYGPLDQGWWPDGLLTPPTEEAMIYDVLIAKEFGMNMIRKHIKIEPARWYYACDKMGMLIWQDQPSGHTGRSQEAKVNYMNELKAMIDTLVNYPSIVMWVPFNESWGQHDTVQVVEWLENYEPSRPVNEASGWNDKGSGSIADMHNYPGPGMRPLEENRVCVLGEFGGLGMPIKGHLWQKDRNWGYVTYQNKDELTDAYVLLLDKMRPLVGMGLSAAVYTQTTDVEGEVNGLMTYDREIIKLDKNRSAAAAKKLYGPAPKLEVLVPSSETGGKKLWKYSFDMPGSDWYMTSYDDSDWKEGLGGFGDYEHPMMNMGTGWTSNDIWLRRSFNLDRLPKGKAKLVVSIRHDDSAEVYLNGEKIVTAKGATGSYVLEYPVSDAVKLLKKGENTLAVYCHEDGGEQFIDAGLSLIIER